jgi:hypothetical protein
MRALIDWIQSTLVVVFVLSGMLFMGFIGIVACWTALGLLIYLIYGYIPDGGPGYCDSQLGRTGC